VERDGIEEDVRILCEMDRYDPSARTLTWTEPEAYPYRRQIAHWTEYFATPARNGGLSDSYTNNFPFEPLVGNLPPPEALLWSALSLITLAS